jgi:3-hydroxyacyl-CoA dehydrogenase/enoyl-CoA hydratase/3-hydroxybutyryl-CoA epimerase
LVDQVAEPADLLETALQRARGLGRQIAPWDQPAAVFDSSPFDFTRPDAYRKIAEAAGIGEDVLARYPAYEAIMDCVVGGWSKSMDDACSWEMDCFVHLIRDPVAGNMVRTLFINRQRAAKLVPAQLAARQTRVAVAGTNSEAIVRQLAAGKAQLVAPEHLAERDIAVLVGDVQVGQGIRVSWQTGEAGCAAIPPATVADAAVWLSGTTAHGCALEVVSGQPQSPGEDAGIVLGQWLRAMVLPTYGKTSFLGQLAAAQSQARHAQLPESKELLVVALAAAHAWGAGGIKDIELADVAAVIAGLHPAYTGGPFNYLRQCGLDGLRSGTAERDLALFRVPDCLPALIAHLSEGA